MRHDHVITVRPVPGGWRVVLDNFQPEMFLSGRTAEQHAHGLARRLADAGDRARVFFQDQPSVLTGTQSFPLA